MAERLSGQQVRGGSGKGACITAGVGAGLRARAAETRITLPVGVDLSGYAARGAAGRGGHGGGSGEAAAVGEAAPAPLRASKSLDDGPAMW